MNNFFVVAIYAICFSLPETYNYYIQIIEFENFCWIENRLDSVFNSFGLAQNALNVRV